MSETVSDETLGNREVELLQLLADGKTIEQAANELGWQEQTAKNCISKIRHKLDAETTAHAVAAAIRRELID